MANLDLRLLEYFVAVAETGHYGRAAERLHVSQSPLSRQIRKLEEDLGVQLFVRGRHGAQMTDSGAALLRPARDLLARSDDFERDARRLGRGEVGRISVGFVQTAVWTGILPSALRAMREKKPDLLIDLKHLVSSEQLKELRGGSLDMALVHARARPSLGDDLKADRLMGDRYVLAISKNNPLASRRSIAPKDLEGTALLAQIDVRDRLHAACSERGWIPDMGPSVGDWPSVLALVDADVGVALVPSSFEEASSRRVAFRPVRWLDIQTALWLVRRPLGGSAAVTELARCLMSSARAP